MLGEKLSFVPEAIDEMEGACAGMIRLAYRNKPADEIDELQTLSIRQPFFEFSDSEFLPISSKILQGMRR